MIFLIFWLQGIFTSASDYLRRATDGRVYFHRVTIVVPPMWDTRACGRLLPVGSYTSRSAVHDSTIKIGTEHPIFGYLPWAQQSRGCGLGGDFISVGYHYILQFNETENSISGSGGNDNDNNGYGSGGAAAGYGQTSNYNVGPGFGGPGGFNSVPTGIKAVFLIHFGCLRRCIQCEPIYLWLWYGCVIWREMPAWMFSSK